MSTGVTQAQLKVLHNMTDAEYIQVLVVLASIPFPVSGAARGFFARLGAAKYAKYVTSGALTRFLVTMVRQIFAAAVTGAIGAGLNSDVLREALLIEIFKATGLEIETLDVEGAKRAVGKLMAKKINQKYGTTFAPFYPLENIIEDVKAQLLSEIMLAVDVNIA